MTFGVDPIGGIEPVGDTEVVILDSLGRPAGSADKMDAHQPPGRFHMAISVFIRDRQGRHLLQRRASTKYHFPGCWANTCCGHPLPGEPASEAAHRRLAQEMRIQAELTVIGSFDYRARDPVNGLVEHERDQLFVGVVDGDPDPDPAEVEEWNWVDPIELPTQIAADPGTYAPWLVIALLAFPDLTAAPSG
ncbi:MAG: isopentenyl-diphosphate Delta-isomerase [Acidimicrobiia bacterium]